MHVIKFYHLKILVVLTTVIHHRQFFFLQYTCTYTYTYICLPYLSTICKAQLQSETVLRFIRGPKDVNNQFPCRVKMA